MIISWNIIKYELHNRAISFLISTVQKGCWKKENYCEFRQNSKIQKISSKSHLVLSSYLLFLAFTHLHHHHHLCHFYHHHQHHCCTRRPISASFLICTSGKETDGDPPEAGKIWENRFFALKTGQQTPSRPEIDGQTCQGFSRTLQNFSSTILALASRFERVGWLKRRLGRKKRKWISVKTQNCVNSVRILKRGAMSISDGMFCPHWAFNLVKVFFLLSFWMQTL